MAPDGSWRTLHFKKSIVIDGARYELEPCEAYYEAEALELSRRLVSRGAVVWNREYLGPDASVWLGAWKGLAIKLTFNDFPLEIVVDCLGTWEPAQTVAFEALLADCAAGLSD